MKGYNKRKFQVLNLASHFKKGLTIADVEHNLAINYDCAKQLLHHYKEQELFTHPRRGIYKLSERGRERLAYFLERIKVSQTVGVDIGLNHHTDHKIQLSAILEKYHAATGTYPTHLRP